MGCDNSSFAVTDPDKDSQEPPQVEKSLEDEVSKEWADELSDLFVLWSHPMPLLLLLSPPPPARRTVF